VHGMEVERKSGSHFYGETGRTFRTEAFRFTESSYEANQRLPKHEHELPHFCFVLQGEYEETLGLRNIARRGPSSLLYLPAGFPHEEHHFARGRHFMIEVDAAHVEMIECHVESPLRLPPDEPVLFAHKAYQEYLRPQSDSGFILDGFALVLFGYLHREHRLLSGAQPAWVKRAKRMLDEEYAIQWSLADLAEAVGIDPHLLSTSFARWFGTTPGEYLRLRRMRLACQMIANGKPLSEVSLAIGFGDQAHFTRMFRNYLGITPLDYCRVVRGERMKISA
jgi:AraC family transcriptional regulator